MLPLLPCATRNIATRLARTIATIHVGVCFIVGVPARAMRSRAVNLPSVSAPDVDSMRDKFEIIGPNTAGSMALVIPFQPFRWLADKEVVGEDRFLVVGEPSVSQSVYGAQPNGAAISAAWVCQRPETLLGSKLDSHLKPILSGVRRTVGATTRPRFITSPFYSTGGA